MIGDILKKENGEAGGVRKFNTATMQTVTGVMRAGSPFLSGLE